MSITGIITAIVIGAIIGGLGRLLLPGRQPIGVVLTVLIGIVAALVGTAIAQKTGAKLQDIVNANKIADPTKIRVGQTLFIPGGK